MNNIQKLKIGLALALFGCVFSFPYIYYVLIRYSATFLFAYFAFCEIERKQFSSVFLLVCLVILFQPFCKFALGRVLWNIVDVLVGLGLIVDALKQPDKSRNHP